MALSLKGSECRSRGFIGEVLAIVGGLAGVEISSILLVIRFFVEKQ